MDTGGYRGVYRFASCSFESGIPFGCSKAEQHWPVRSSAWTHAGATTSAYGCSTAPSLRPAPTDSTRSSMEHSVPVTPTTPSQASPAFPLTPQQQAPRSFQPWMTDAPMSSSFAPPLLSSPWYTPAPAAALGHSQPAFETSSAYQPSFLAERRPTVSVSTHFSLPPTPPKESATEDVSKSPDYVFQFNRESFRPPRDYTTDAHTTNIGPALPSLPRPYPFPPPLTSMVPSAFTHLANSARPDVVDGKSKIRIVNGKF